jgi:hypothetical protein
MLFKFWPTRRQKHNDMSQEITGKRSAEKETSVQEPSRDEELATPNGEHPKTLEGVSAKEEDDAGKVYPPARKVVVVMISLYLSLFLVSQYIYFHIPLARSQY